MKHIHLPVANLFGFTILLSNFLVYYFLGKCLFTELYFSSLIWLLIKLFIDFISVFSSFTLYNKKSILKYTLPMYFMYPIYLLLVLFLNLIPIKFEWKNRPVLNLKPIETSKRILFFFNYLIKNPLIGIAFFIISSAIIISILGSQYSSRLLLRCKYTNTSNFSFKAWN